MIMLKILVILVFIKSLWKLFTNASWMARQTKSISKLIIDYEGDVNKVADNHEEDFVIWILSFIITFTLYIVELIMCFFLLKYDTTYITLLFILLSLIDIIKVARTYTKGKKKNNPKNGVMNDLDLAKLKVDFSKADEYTFKQKLIRLINVMYFGYAIYILFIM